MSYTVTTYSDKDQAFNAALDWHQREMMRNYSAADFDDEANEQECPYDEVDLALDKAETLAASLGNLNSMLCQALRDKAHSYPPSQPYRAAAYEATAKKVEALEVSVLDLPGHKWYRLGVGPKTGEFVVDWMLTLVRDCEEAYFVLADIPYYNKARAQIKAHKETRAKAEAADGLIRL
jgi:hypothetical protein